MRRYCRFTALIVAMLLPLSAFALGLQEAKSQLLVGESVTGYIGVVKANAGVVALANDINAKRKASYQKIAKRNGTSLAAVEQLAAKKAIAKTVNGQMVQRSLGGAWLRK
ncbi:MAG: YdbL family protein [Gammaproteobacteria bacterium]|nr:YdbL family protein [Gammaproteobacteria bacterium]